MDAVALTDHGAMYGALHFYNACKQQGVKPIVGVEAYMAKDSRFDKQGRQGKDQYHITFLAMNHEGYQNLMRMTSKGYLEGFSYKPRIDMEIIEEHNQNVIATSGCMSSIFNKLLREGKDEEAEEWFRRFKEIFGDRFYVEIQNHPRIAEQRQLRKKQIAMAEKLDIELVATNDVHYIEQSDSEAQDALVCVQTRKLISDDNRLRMADNPDLYLKTAEEMYELFPDHPEAVENTVKIAERCNLEIPVGDLHFPNFPTPDGKTDKEYFREKAYEGLHAKFDEVTEEMVERLEYEIGIINDKGYANYFLITQDFVIWAKEQGIAVGPGRGSAAGSLVSFAMDITTVNPLQHGLRFERFLNPSRPTPPDIDLDFADDRRDEVIQYVNDEYGEDKVAHVITFGRMEARVSIRDIGRVLGMPYEEPDKIAKLIPNDPGSKVGLDEALRTVPELKEYYKQPKFKKLIDLARKVESNVRHSSVHAAAVIIADKPLTDYTPVQKDTKSGKTLTQYDMYALDLNVREDAIGLLKFDFLGLRNLSVIQKCLSLIKETKGEEIDIDNIPLTDKPTYEMLSKGETTGVFQLESAGMRRVARSLQPNQFSDITAMVALYRPGPMELIPRFVECKHDPSKIEYPDDALEPVLGETYGIMVYQEQVMEIAHVMAGYTIAEADILRKAIGKKKKKLLDKNKKRFIEQSVANGYDEQVARDVWSFIEAFANYGFNKAHACSYAMIAYQTGYLKANYPVEYLTALMSTEAASHSQNRDERVSQAIENAKRMSILVKPPEINRSGAQFTIETDEDSLEGLAIRFGLNGIKNVGSAAIENILETRERLEKEKNIKPLKTGEPITPDREEPFGSFTEFLIETESRKVNKKVLESLVQVGAFDEFGTRASMLENLDDIRNRATQFHSEVEGQDSLFENIDTAATDIADTFAHIDEYPQRELLSFEKELLGLYLTDHPLGDALDNVQARANKEIDDLDKRVDQDKIYFFGGFIKRFREVTTKKSGKKMGFGTLRDRSGSVQFVIFPRAYEKWGQYMEVDRVMMMKGKVDVREGEIQIIVEKITVPDEAMLHQTPPQKRHEIFIPRKTEKVTLEKIGKLLKSKPGDHKVIILIPNGGQPKRMVLPYGVAWNDKLEGKVQQLLE